jgi:hypothetical protein
MIQHYMLVVESSHRKPCQELWQALDFIYRQCLLDSAFAAESNPWSHSNLMAEPVTHSVEVPMENDAEKIINRNFPMLPVHQGQPKNVGFGDGAAGASGT